MCTHIGVASIFQESATRYTQLYMVPNISAYAHETKPGSSDKTSSRLGHIPRKAPAVLLHTRHPSTCISYQEKKILGDSPPIYTMNHSVPGAVWRGQGDGGRNGREERPRHTHGCVDCMGSVRGDSSAGRRLICLFYLFFHTQFVRGARTPRLAHSAPPKSEDFFTFFLFYLPFFPRPYIPSG